MQIVIDIPEELYNNIQKDCGIYPYRLVYDAMKNGTPLPTDAVDRVTIKEYLESFGNVKTEQEPCEDVVSRQELLKSISTWDKFGCDADTKLVPYKDHYVPYIHYDDVINCINGMPSVKTQPKTGHWITTRTFMHDGEYYCDRCKCDAPNNEKWDYCPNCGAKMSDVVDGMPEVKE